MLLLLAVVKENEIMFLNQNFEKANSSFRDGEIGILLILNAVLKLL